MIAYRASMLPLALARPNAGLLLLAVCVLLAPTTAWCHATQLSSSRVEVRGNVLTGLLELNGRDVEIALNTAVFGPTGEVAADALRGAEGPLAVYLATHARVYSAGAGPCEARMSGARPKAEHVLAQMQWTCPPGAGPLTYEVTLFQEIDPASRHMVTASGDVQRMALLSVSAQSVSLSDTRASLGELLWNYFLSGVEHIAIGYDHIAFLVAVILWGRRVWPLVGVVTAFTVAHTITLSLAVLGVVQLPSRLVEPLIGLSIVYVAAENFFVRDLRRRAWVTFAFGLIHGFGFASVLRDYGIPQGAVAPALAAFNVGVEVGQIVIVVLVLVAMRGVERMMGERYPRFVRTYPYVVSGTILLLGVYWTADRLLSGG